MIPVSWNYHVNPLVDAISQPIVPSLFQIYIRAAAGEVWQVPLPACLKQH